MSKSTPSRPPIAKAKRTFYIVASRFNEQYVAGLIDHVSEELRELAPHGTILIHRVPGSFEIPVIAREVAIQNEADEIIACGVILQGETDHTQNLRRSVTEAQNRITTETSVPEYIAVLGYVAERQLW